MPPRQLGGRSAVRGRQNNDSVTTSCFLLLILPYDVLICAGSGVPVITVGIAPMRKFHDQIVRVRSATAP